MGLCTGAWQLRQESFGTVWELLPWLNWHLNAAPLCLISISVQQSKSIWEHREVKD